jgi:hypothetical protein
MELSVKAWGETIGKLIEHNSKNLFALSPNTDLGFSLSNLKRKINPTIFRILHFSMAYQD